MIKDPKERFTETAERYRKFRPWYPDALVDWVLGLAPGGAIADLGCGTGISTRLFAQRGRFVVGIDPNEEMLRQARAEGGTFVRAAADRTGLADRSVGLVIAAQAFHWFDVPLTIAEIRRVLAPGGWACAFWNTRGRTPFLDEYEHLLRTASSEYGQLRTPRATVEEIQRHVVGAREAEFDNSQTLDREGFFGRVYSSSYVVHGVKDRASFDRALEDLFARYSPGGRITWVYRTIAIAWQS